MINKNSILSVLLFSLLIISGCKEEETVVVSTPTKTELLTASPWIITAQTFSPGVDLGDGQGIITDYYPFMDPCEKDDLLVFESDGTGNLDEGAIKCDPLSPQFDPCVWSFYENETQLIIEATDFRDTVNIALTATSLTIFNSFDDGSGVTTTVSQIFKHQ